jgi:hypothetical protein
MSSYDPNCRLPAQSEHIDDDRRHGPLVVGATPLECWIVSDSLTRAVIHYSGIRTFGCYLFHGAGPCPGCVARPPWPRWERWYLSVCLVEGPSAPIEILPLTKVAVESCPELIRDEGYLWGRRIRVHRHPPVYNGVMYGEIVYEASAKDLPKSDDTLVRLIRIWQARTRSDTLARYGRGEGRAPLVNKEKGSGK